MAREDVRKKLARQPLGTKLALLFGVLFLAGLVYWQFSYSPLRKQVSAEKSRHEQLVADSRRLIQREREYSQLIEQRDELEDKLRGSLVSLPVAAELPAFFVHLQRQAAAAGVRVQKWSRRDERPVGEYMKVPVEMEIQGSFHQVMHYFKLVHETERVITIEDLALGTPRAGDDDLVLSAEFTAATFRQTGDGFFADLDIDPEDEPGAQDAESAPGGGDEEGAP